MTPVDAFVTGATGLLGRWLLPQLTADGRRVAILLRGDRSRLDDLRTWVDAKGGRGARLVGLHGDLAAPDLGLSPASRDVARTARLVFHLGAAMSFGLSPERARAVNVEGSRQVAELAAVSPDLTRLVLATGFQHRPSPWWARGQYHESKLEADREVRRVADAHGIPLTTVHPGPVVGDSKTGETTQFWGWPDLVRAVGRRRLPVVPGGPRHRMPIVAVDFVTAFLARAATLDETVGGQYWLLHDDTPPLGELLGVVADELGVPAPRLRVPVPLAAVGLRAGLGRVTGMSAEALTFVDTERYPVDDTDRIAREMGIVAPEAEELARRTTRWLADHWLGTIR